MLRADAHHFLNYADIVNEVFAVQVGAEFGHLLVETGKQLRQANIIYTPASGWCKHSAKHVDGGRFASA